MTPERILVVENLPFFRLSLQKILEGQGYEAVTMGIEREKIFSTLEGASTRLSILSGDVPLEWASHIAHHCQIPVLLFVHPQAYPKETEAFRKAAFAFLYKNPFKESDVESIQKAIQHKVRLAVGLSEEQYTHRMTFRKSHLLSWADYLPYRVVVIGASTGGTESIEQIFQELPANFPIPIVVAQHMPALYSYSFAERLNKISAFNVLVPQEGERLMAGNAYLLSGENNMVLAKDPSEVVRFFTTEKRFSAHNFPSIDALMQSAASVFGAKTLGVILSGMGNDGTQGMMAIAQAGGETIVQDVSTSVVASMPLSAQQLGVAKKVFSLTELIDFFKRLL